MKHFPFHFSFLVKDIESTRKFYLNILGCKEGRSSDTWVDFDFYGNQLSCHVNEKIPEPIYCGFVDAVVVPIPHFGCVIPWEEFYELAKKIEDNKIEFIIKPTIRYVGEPGEQATMFFQDFSGNSLEFKSYRNPDHMFTIHKV